MPLDDEAMRIGFLAFDGVQSLDVFGPLEVFHGANALRPGTYETVLITPDGGPATTTSGVTLTPHASPATATDLDTLLVAGGEGSRRVAANEALTSWLRGAATRTRRVGSVCTGAFALAAAGLLDGRRATTHWAWCDALQRRHPEIEVDPEPIFVRDRQVWTSAGVTAGIDLALALVEDDLGRDVALELARHLVLFVRRPGGQTQFSATLAGQRAERDVIRELQQWMTDHLEADLSVPALAERAHISPRQFARVFAKEVGMTPAAYAAALRVERARALLETTDLQLDRIAVRCGFGTVETLRRSFARRLHVSPSDYRERFAA